MMIYHTNRDVKHILSYGPQLRLILRQSGCAHPCLPSIKVRLQGLEALHCLRQCSLRQLVVGKLAPQI